MALFVLSYVQLFDAVPACDRRTDGQTQCHSIYCAVRARAVIKRLCCRPTVTVVQHGVDKVKVLTDMAVAELLVVVCMDMDLYNTVDWFRNVICLVGESRRWKRHH